MKKLKLKALELGVNEVLTRTQLKTVMGGNMGGGNCGTSECTSDSNCSTKFPKCKIVVCQSDQTAANYCYCPSNADGCPVS